MTTNNKGRNGGDRATLKTANSRNHTRRGVDCIRCERPGQWITGTWGYQVKGNPKALLFPVCSQCGIALDNSEQARIRQHQPLLSFVLTADHAIPEAAARVHDLRCMGFNILTRIVPAVQFRGRTRRNAALYSLGVPEWPSPGFVAGEEGGRNDE